MTKNSSIILLSFLLVLSSLFLLLALNVFADSYSNSIDSVKIIKDSMLEVKVSLADYYISGNKNSTVYLLKLPEYAKLDDIGEEHVEASAPVSNSLNFKISYTADDNCSKYIIAEKDPSGKFNALSDFHFIDNTNTYANNKAAFPSYKSKKGLCSKEGYTSYTNILSVSHTVIDIDLCDILLTQYEDGSIPRINNGISYYFNGEAVSKLDKLVKAYSENNTCVYFRILLSDKGIDSPLRFMYATTDKSSDAQYYAPDMSDRECCEYLKSFYSFLAERYANDKYEHGFAACYIIGSAINSNRYGHYFGESEITSYTDNYAKELRLAYNSVSSVYKNAKVFVSIDNNFSARSSNLNYVGDEKLDYPAKDFLRELNSAICKEGNIPWDVAINACPSEKTETDFWNDDNALFSNDTLFITIRNLEVLSSFLEQDIYLYNGNHRRIIIDRFALSSDNRGSGELLQAAAYAYAYYLAEEEKYVDALIYSEVYDSEKSHYGLISDEPFAEKELLNTIQFIDSSNSYRIYETAPAYLGYDSWSDVLKINPLSSSTHTAVSGLRVLQSDIDDKYYENIVFSFENGSKNGFEEGYFSLYTELKYDGILGKAVLSSKSAENGFPELGMIYCVPERKIDISTSSYITLNVKADSNELGSERVIVKLLGTDSSGREAVYTSTASIKNSVWEKISFDISEFSEKCDKIEKIEIYYGAENGYSSTSEIEFSLSELSLRSSTEKSAAFILIWIVLVVFLVAVAVVAVRNVFAIKNRNKQIRFDI